MKTQEKLELQHLAPYLPYGLKVLVPDIRTKKSKILILTRLCKDKCYFGIRNGYQVHLYEYCKPILRPLSDLTTKMRLKIEYEEEGLLYDLIYDDSTDVFNDCEMLPRFLFERLVVEHFDVFGLIEKGLAIDLNTI